MIVPSLEFLLWLQICTSVSTVSNSHCISFSTSLRAELICSGTSYKNVVCTCIDKPNDTCWFKVSAFLSCLGLSKLRLKCCYNLLQGRHSMNTSIKNHWRKKWLAIVFDKLIIVEISVTWNYVLALMPSLLGCTSTSASSSFTPLILIFTGIRKVLILVVPAWRIQSSLSYFNAYLQNKCTDRWDVTMTLAVNPSGDNLYVHHNLHSVQSIGSQIDTATDHQAKLWEHY